MLGEALHTTELGGDKTCKTDKEIISILFSNSNTSVRPAQQKNKHLDTSERGNPVASEMVKRPHLPAGWKWKPQENHFILTRKAKLKDTKTSCARCWGGKLTPPAEMQIDHHLEKFPHQHTTHTPRPRSFSNVENVSGLGMLSWECACLTCMKPWLQSPAPHKVIVMTHACNPNTQEVEAEEAQVQDYP